MSLRSITSTNGNIGEPPDGAWLPQPRPMPAPAPTPDGEPEENKDGSKSDGGNGSDNYVPPAQTPAPSTTPSPVLIPWIPGGTR